MGPTTVNAAAQSADFEFAALAEARRYRAALARAFGPFLRGRVLAGKEEAGIAVSSGSDRLAILFAQQAGQVDAGRAGDEFFADWLEIQWHFAFSPSRCGRD